jgi:hypothetical protein
VRPYKAYAHRVIAAANSTPFGRRTRAAFLQGQDTLRRIDEVIERAQE